MLVDTHCHYNLAQFATDTKEAIARAVEASVTRMIVVGYDPESSGKAVSLAALFCETLSAAVGIHPHDAKTWTSDTEAQLEAWASEPYSLRNRRDRSRLLSRPVTATAAGGCVS